MSEILTYRVARDLAIQRKSAGRRRLSLRCGTAAALVTSASLLLSPAVYAKPVAKAANAEVSSVDTQSQSLIQKLGKQIVRISRHKSKDQKAQCRGEEGGYTSLSVTKFTPPSKGLRGKGTYILTASFKGDSCQKMSNLVQVGASQNAGANGVYASVDLRQCKPGYSLTGEYDAKGGPTTYLNAYTQPQTNERGISSSELDATARNFSFIIHGFSAGSKISQPLDPPFPGESTPPLSPRC